MTDPFDDTDPIIVRAERLVAGGACLSRRDDGRIVLVDGALPGETVEVRVAERRGAASGELLRVIEASPDRIAAGCPHVADGCGGCDLPEFAHGAQIEAKVGIVADAMRRLGGIDEPVVEIGPALDPWGFRTSMRFAVADGRAGLRRASSHDVVTLDTCAIAHPLLVELVQEGRFADATEVTLRVGAATGERLAIIAPDARGVSLPDDVVYIGAGALAQGHEAHFHEKVDGRTWRISAESFFQTRPDGAQALIDVVRSQCSDVLAGSGTLLDLYSGVGLFSGALLEGRSGWRTVAVERAASSVSDARHNLVDLDARVVRSKVERFKPPSADLVIADPSRAGLGREGVAVIAAADPERVVVVSCDAAAAGRDAGLLDTAGWSPVRSIVVDLFPHTHHVEVVTTFERF